MNGENENEILEVEEQEDGSAIIMQPQSPVDETAQDFYANLAETLDPHFVRALGMRLSEEIALDKEARKKRDKQYEEGIRRTGLGEDAPGGAQFEGASRAVHPMLAEGCVDFSARAMKELFPPNGPVKTQIIGALQDAAAMDRAERKATFMNWQLTEQICEYRGSLEQLLTQLPLGGSQFMKFWFDEEAGRIKCEFVPIDYIYLPYEAANYFTAERMTHSFPITQLELERRIKRGIYIETRSLSAPSFLPEESQSQKATDKVEGKTETGENEDGVRNFLECYTVQEIPDPFVPEGRTAPYIVTIDETTDEVLAIYRNWEPQDTKFLRVEWFVEFQLIPWRGAYAIGLPHLIGGLSIAATGALRALLDSAHINNFPGGLKLKGARASGQTVPVAPTELVEIEAPAGVDDIRKVVTPFPFPGPSPVLFQLLEWVTAAAKQTLMTSTEATMNVGDRTPVGTTMALIEQTAITYSAIHSRLHESQKQCLKIIQRLNRDFLDEQVVVEELGKLIIRKDEFTMTNDVVPVSDPAIFSEAQRYAQMQALLQMSQDVSVPWNKLKIYQRILKQMKIQGAEELLPSPPQPVSADPISEIVAAMSGQPLAAQPQMQHMQHIQEELSFLLDPVFGAANPTIINPGFQTIMADIQQHMVFLFSQLKQQVAAQAQQQVGQMLMQQAMQMGLPQEQMGRFMQMQSANPQLMQQVQMLTQQLWQQAQQQLAPIVQMMQQADQLVKSKIPPPQDPALAAQLQAVQMQEQTKKEIAQLRQQMEQEKLQMESQHKQAQLQLEGFVRTELERELSRQVSETELLKNRDDNLQKMETETSKNSQDNATNMEMARLRAQADNERAIITKQMEIEAQQGQMMNDMVKGAAEAEQNMTQKVIEQTMQNALEREKMDNEVDMQKRQLESQEKIAKLAQKTAQTKAKDQSK